MPGETNVMMPNRMPASPRRDTAHQFRDRPSTSTTGTRMSHTPEDLMLALGLDRHPPTLLPVGYRHGDFEDAIAEHCGDPVFVRPFGQRNGAKELPVGQLAPEKSIL